MGNPEPDQFTEDRQDQEMSVCSSEIR